MFQKIANVLSIISFVMVASMSGGAYFGYKYVTSEQFKSRVMNEILGNGQGMMPKILDNGLPKMTGPSMPTYPEFSVMTNLSCSKCFSEVEILKKRDAFD